MAEKKRMKKRKERRDRKRQKEKTEDRKKIDAIGSSPKISVTQTDTSESPNSHYLHYLYNDLDKKRCEVYVKQGDFLKYA